MAPSPGWRLDAVRSRDRSIARCPAGLTHLRAKTIILRFRPPSARHFRFRFRTF